MRIRVRGTMAVALLWAAGAMAAPPEADGIRVTGRLLSVNGVSEIPAGLFGVHATPLNEAQAEAWGVEAERVIVRLPDGRPAARRFHQVVECLFDRYQPALVLTRPDWKAYLATVGRAYGSNTVSASEGRAVEFWNEPYLNWAGKPGVNYDGVWYDLANARTGGPMTPRGTNQPLPGMVWDRPRPVARPARGGEIDYVATRYAPEGVKAGDTFDRGKKTFKVEERWWGRDVTQTNWWSGPVNLGLYLSMLEPFARAAKEVNPSLAIVAGWGFHLNQDDWAAWRVLHAPTIDACWQWIDGYDEHHYGGDTRSVAVTYEMAYAYTLARYGKRLRFYNTEAGGMLDPERPGNAKPRAEGPDAARGAFQYAVRDILYLLQTCPDKAATRFAHEAHLTGGDELAFKLLKPLRGKLLEVTGRTGTVWSAASLDGKRLCVALYNDGREAAAVSVRIEAPAGCALTGGRQAIVRFGEGKPQLDEVPLAVAERGGWQGVVTQAAGTATCLLLDLDRAPEGSERVDLMQHVAAEVLQTVAPGATAVFRVPVGAPDRDHATGASLRVVVDQRPEGWPTGVTCTVNGNALALRGGDTPIQDVALPAEWLRATNEVVFSTAAGATGPLRVCAVSVLTVDCDQTRSPL